MNRVLKILFAICILIIIILTIVLLKKQNTKEKKEKDNEIIVKELKKEKYFNFSVVGSKNLNPYLSKNANVYELSPLIYGSLVRINSEFKIDYEILESIKKVENFGYLIQIKKAKFVDGSNVTTKDVEFSINQGKRNTSLYSNKLNNISNIKIIDDRNMIIYLKNDVPFFEYYLEFPILKEVDMKCFESAEYAIPISCGKYFANFADDKIIKFVRNENFILKKPEMEKIEVRLYDNISDAYHNFRSGNIDILNSSRADIAKYIGKLAYTKLEYKLNEVGYININEENIYKKILNFRSDKKSKEMSKKYSKKISENIKNIIDYDNIMESLGFSYTRCFNILDYGSFLEKENIYEKEQEKYTRNLDITINEFEKEGFKKIKGKYVISSFGNINLDLVYRKDIDEQKKIAYSLINSFEKFGIKINAIEVDKNEYLKRAKAFNYSLIIVSQSQNEAPNIYNTFGDDSFLKISDGKINNLVQKYNEVSKEIDENKYKKLEGIYIELSKYLLKNNCFIPIYRKTKQLYIAWNIANYSTPNFHTIFNKFNFWYRK